MNLIDLLPPEIQDELKNENVVYDILRSGLDFVAGMTDSNCLPLYRKIKGIALPEKG